MSTKDQLLKALETNKGGYLSGEELAQQLSISRNSVWKAIKALQGQGYKINAVPNKGYSLDFNTDIISPSVIQSFLAPNAILYQPTVFKTIDSTNNYAKEIANQGAIEGSVIISEYQTNGRGRAGRKFYAPENTGIYMSILLRPTIKAESAVMLTTLTAVAVCEAIEAICDKKAEIKWVNDIFVDSKKVCGILSEASFNMENNGIDYVVIGIGINVFTPYEDFPEELKDIATSLFSKPNKDVRNALIAGVLNRFDHYYKNFASGDFISQYRRRCFVIGKTVNVLDPKGNYAATVLDVDDNCRLVVTSDSIIRTLSSGEISIRM